MTGNGTEYKRRKIKLHLDDDTAGEVQSAWLGLNDLQCDPDFDARYWKFPEVPCVMAVMDLGGLDSEAGDAVIVYVSMQRNSYNASYVYAQLFFVKNGQWTGIVEFQRDEGGVTLTLDDRAD